MKFFAAATLLFVSALAAPNYQPCSSGLYSEAKCCATDVLGIADLNCQTREYLISTSAGSYPDLALAYLYQSTLRANECRQL